MSQKRELELMKGVEGQIPRVAVQYEGLRYTGRVRVNLRRGCCIVVVRREFEEPLLFEFSGSAIRRAVNTGKVLMG